MTKDQKIEFIDEILKGLRKEIMDKIHRMPYDWDGFELRQYIDDVYVENYLDKSKLKGERKKEYENTKLTLNL